MVRLRRFNVAAHYSSILSNVFIPSLSSNSSPSHPSSQIIFTTYCWHLGLWEQSDTRCHPNQRSTSRVACAWWPPKRTLRWIWQLRPPLLGKLVKLFCCCEGPAERIRRWTRPNMRQRRAVDWEREIIEGRKSFSLVVDCWLIQEQIWILKEVIVAVGALSRERVMRS